MWYFNWSFLLLVILRFARILGSFFFNHVLLCFFSVHPNQYGSKFIFFLALQEKLLFFIFFLFWRNHACWVFFPKQKVFGTTITAPPPYFAEGEKHFGGFLYKKSFFFLFREKGKWVNCPFPLFFQKIAERGSS